ncbi:glycoside hydrolase family 88 protein [Seonamhaeicola sp. MEBiC1930]|uniref:glycoside hydrolase family 88/105 protein n=1 Tax=Seonamhaeicola sp. MEBiC01930 TaxID=2976768 RepID=UPI00324393C9
MKIKLIVFFAFIFTSTVSLYTHAQNNISKEIQLEISPETVGKSIISNIVDRRFGWRYQKVCSYYGGLIFAYAINDKSISNMFKKGYAPFYNGIRKPHSGHVDYNVFGIWPFELYRQYGDKKYLNLAKELADTEWENPREDGLTNLTRFWIDDMYMVGALQVQAYRATKDKVYIDRAALQLKTYCDNLQKPNGLFHHRDDAPFFWGRGNGWAVAALTELLLVLPKDHEYYSDILKAFQSMMNTLLKYQDPNGMWHQLINDSKSYVESSCTGMFLYGLASGVHKGWLPMGKYRHCIEKGWNALASYVNEDGETENVCVGTNAKNNKKHYLTRPKRPGNFHGQAAVLWAATAMIRLQNNK